MPAALAAWRRGTATSLASIDELLAWAEEGGLGDRMDAVLRSSRLSYRMTAIPAGGGTGQSKVWGRPSLAAGVQRPAHQGVPLEFIAQFDLRDAAAPGAVGCDLLAAFHSPSGWTRISRGELGHCAVLRRGEGDAPEDPPACPIPDDLAAALAHARRQGCEYALFDRDAPPSDGLPVLHPGFAGPA